MMNRTHDDSPNGRYFPPLEQHTDRIRSILQRTGTPIFLGERLNLLARYDALVHCLESLWGPHVIGYSFKTNYQVAESRVFQPRGVWAEVVSGREYRLARQLGYPGSKIIFNGPLKSDADLHAAIEDGALVNVNDQDELDRLIRMVPAQRAPFAMGLRLSSTLPKLGHSRFGFSLEHGEASAAWETIRRSPQLRLTALHTHLYGDTDDPQLYREAATRMGQFIQNQLGADRHGLKYLDMGGGYPAHNPKPKSRESWNPQPIERYIAAMVDALRPLFPDDPRPILIVEPGRYLTCDGIVLVTQVVHVKERGDTRMINCDGSISMIPLTHYCPQVIRVFDSQWRPRAGGERPTVLFGSTCRENDILFQGEFPASMPGDYLVHFAAGAYNSSLSPDFIFESPALELF